MRPRTSQLSLAILLEAVPGAAQWPAYLWGLPSFLPDARGCRTWASLPRRWVTRAFDHGTITLMKTGVTEATVA
jgi:hypothetical protein